jgi:hypothetical protein
VVGAIVIIGLLVHWRRDLHKISKFASIIKKIVTVTVVGMTIAIFIGVAILIIIGEAGLGIVLGVFLGLPFLGFSAGLVFGPSGPSRSDGMIAEQLRTDLEAKPWNERTEEDQATLYFLHSDFIPVRDKRGRLTWYHRNRMRIDGEPLRASTILSERENAREGIQRFFTRIIGIALVIAAVIFLLPPAISAFENARLVWQLVIITGVAVGFIVAAIERAARNIRDGKE